MGAWTKALLVLVVAAVGVIAGALLSGDDSSSAESFGSTTVRVSYQADVGEQTDAEAAPETLLELGGLIIKGSCTNYGLGAGKHLAVSATTTFDDSVIAASFVQEKGREPTAYTFGQSDFDRSYGGWDFLGTNPYNTAGTLSYSRPDGGQVAV